MMTKTARKAVRRTARLPLGKDLPDSDGIPMDSDIHREQASKYLIEPLRRWLVENRQSAFVSGNSFVYYDPHDVKRGVSGPDVYVVWGGQQRGQSKWVVWEEGGLLPTLSIELLSPRTEANDRGKKFVLLRDQFKAPDYFLFDTDVGRLEGFHLVGGGYEVTLPVKDDVLGCQWLPCSGMPLWVGVYQNWLRWFDPAAGCLVWTDEELVARTGKLGQQKADDLRERAEAEHNRAEAERERAEAERQRADRAEAELRLLKKKLGLKD
jgi:Uma2 family endonuclease